MLSYEHKLKQREDTNDLERVASYFRGKNYFDSDDGTQNYLVFQPMYKYFKTSVKGSTTMFFHGNQKDCLMKKLVLLPHLVIIKLQA